MRFIAWCLGILLIAGCKPSEPQAGKKAGDGGSSVINAMTQKSKTDAARKAAEQIREIDEERDREIESSMGEW
ncbi:MAG: hypothetical protein BWY59_00485 [Verrucomicrobia bacterium ADurb.Bin345]|nr:MAG: hypothetical protein BWY59_00485 [Verrucomicrobia bacterium ADurb.Bin345]